ncbi:DUF1680 domain containing protein [Musa troglodytarum]|uniref:DUF1680 domain containing protein n=1 Tax=Musa troglodytarum TaxID=320322 RepID=A0A9E7GQT9_9LILI|nr:DUF1680 domain containing protein [Musa troglodytarum]
MAFFPATANRCTDRIFDASSSTVAHYQYLGRNGTTMVDSLSRYHLNPTEESTWMNILPRKAGQPVVTELDWAMLYRAVKRPGLKSAANGGNFLKEISLRDVRVDPSSVHGRAQQTNLEYLLLLDVDRLVWSFRKLAGLPTPGEPYLGWEDPNGQLRGHFVGHFMSATALMWAATEHGTIGERMSAVVDALDECQKKIGTGYLSAFSTEEFDLYEEVKAVWAPYYTIHKIMAGLVNQYLFANNAKALNMAIWMAEYFGNRVIDNIKKRSIAWHWEAMNEETGGMNDVLYTLYTITNNTKHLVLAHLFDKPCFLGPLAVQADLLSGLHGNTHIPIVVGAQKRYEITGDLLYKEIGLTFMDILNSSHIYATGGSTVNEHWAEPNRLASFLLVNTEESCTTYNLLKVSRNLLRWTKNMAYADHYERALTNGVLSIQRGTEPGIMIYFLPMNPGGSKAVSGQGGWGTPTATFWCCYGTATESFSKLGDSIYFEEEGAVPTLYVIQFISSTLNWRSGGLTLRQNAPQVSSLDHHFRVQFTVASVNKSPAKSSTLSIRVPSWTSNSGAVATINGQSVAVPPPGETAVIYMTSNSQGTLVQPFSLMMDGRKYDRPEFSSLRAVLFGPYLLVGLSSGEWDMGKQDAVHGLSDWILPVPAHDRLQLVSLTQESCGGGTTFLSAARLLTMAAPPKLGTNAAAQATFRLVYSDRKAAPPIASREAVVGRVVLLEPFDLPDQVVRHQGAGKGLVISATADVPQDRTASVFRVAEGLDGNPTTVSLEADSTPGCFVHHDCRSGDGVRLVCPANDAERHGAAFRTAASFTLGKGLGRYHPISFTAKGTKRSFLLQPLLSLRDETYTTYFNIGV